MNLYEIMYDEHIQLTGIIVGLVFITGNLAEMLYTNFKQKQFYTFKAFIVNLSLALLQQLSDVFNKLIFFAGFIFIQQNYSILQLLHLKEIKVGFPILFSAAFPFIAVNYYMLFVWLFILIIADFCQYWLHRLSHEVNIMWAGHIVHHSMEEYNYTVALRQSFIEGIYTWIFYLPLAFFGIPWQLFIMAYAISLIWQFLVHTRVIHRLGFLEYILATPSHHRVHHGKNPQYIDKNYGAFFIIWDKLFGTFEPEADAVDYGVTVPLQTHNPVWVNTHHHVHIFKLLIITKGFGNKCKVLFGKPSDTASANPSMKKIAQPQHTTLPVLKNGYIFINFLLTALCSFLLVSYYQETQRIIVFLPVAMLIIVSLTINVALLENQKWADYAEVVKLIFILGIGIALLLQSRQINLLALLVTGIPVFMLFQTWVIAKSYQKQLNTIRQT